MPTYFELHDYKDVRIVKEVVCGDHLVPVGECGCRV
jgi:hypothetical protein